LHVHKLWSMVNYLPSYLTCTLPHTICPHHPYPIPPPQSQITHVIKSPKPQIPKLPSPFFLYKPPHPLFTLIHTHHSLTSSSTLQQWNPPEKATNPPPENPPPHRNLAKTANHPLECPVRRRKEVTEGNSHGSDLILLVLNTELLWILRIRISKIMKKSSSPIPTPSPPLLLFDCGGCVLLLVM